MLGCNGSDGAIVQAFMAPASGNSWTKLFADGYSGGAWAVDKLIQAGGQHSVTIPDVPAGDYLMRGMSCFFAAAPCHTRLN